MAVTFESALAACPLVAILRGLTPGEAICIGEVLVAAGFRIVEVPLNSPEPFESITRLKAHFGDKVLVGAGTVLSESDVERVARAGGQLVVSPNFDESMVRATLSANLISIPGVATPTELFAAVRAGATAVKLFPAEMIAPTVVKALRAVAPKTLRMLAVGGIVPENMAGYLAAGIDGFGIGSPLYVPGRSASDVAARAAAYLAQLNSRPYG